jgi:hypothetical protein
VPITVAVDPEERVRYAVFSGEVTDRELVEAFRGSIDSPDFDPTLNGLVDLRAVRTLDVTSNGIWQLGQILGASDRAGPPRRVAIVASSDFQFGMARMAAALLSTGGRSTAYEAFRDMGVARAWLGLGPEREAPAR